MKRLIRGISILVIPTVVIGAVIFAVVGLYGDKSLYTIDGGGNAITNLVYSPDGAFLTCGKRKSVDVYNMKTHNRVFNLNDANSMVATAHCSPDGKTIYGVFGTSLKGSGEVLDAWNAATGTAEPSLTVKDAQRYRLSADCNYAAVTKRDSTGYTGTKVEIWNVAKKSLVASLTTKSPAADLAFSNDDSQLAASEVNAIEILNIKTGASVSTLPVPSKLESVSASVSYSPGGAYLLTSVFQGGNGKGGKSAGEMQINVFDTKTFKLVRTISNCMLYNYSPDGKYIIVRVASTDNDVTGILTNNRGLNVIELSTGKIVMQGIQGHKSGIAAAAFSPDMKYIATGGADDTIKIWNFSPKK